MAETSDIVIIGAGVLGLCSAVELTQRGHNVTVVDAGVINASQVAAGMIAPALESVADEVAPERAALLRDAAGLWPAFAQALGIPLRPGPSEWRSDDADTVTTRLASLGFAAHSRSGSVETDDMQVDPGQAMAAMTAALKHPVVPATVGSIRRTADGWIVGMPGREIAARGLVLATGAAAAVQGLPLKVARSVDAIQPIRGQIGSVGQRLVEQVTRGTEAYVVPTEDGAMIGATMDVGRRDLAPESTTGQALLRAAGRLIGRSDIEDIKAVTWRVGIRGTTADGLPLAGPTGETALHLALAPRRNGWLLGPLVAQVVADGIEDRPRGEHATAFDPLRFG